MIFKSKLSIITVNLNNKDGLQNTINSIINQSYRDFEWLIIDGGSTDGSKELIEKYSDQINYWVSEPDKGIYNGMNKGILASNGEYLLFLNSGDFFYDNKVLEKVFPLLVSHDFYIGIEKYNDSLWYLKDVNPEYVINYFIFGGIIPHGSSFINKRVFEKYGLYKEDIEISADICLFYKALFLGNATLNIIPSIITVFEGGGISCANKDKILSEIINFRESYPYSNCLYEFYKNNYEIINTLKQNRIVFFIFRIYFYCKRKFKRKLK